LSERANARGAARARSGLQGLELWCVDLRGAGPALLELERLTPRLSASERESARTLADAAAADEWLAAHVALRVLLERAVGAEWRGMPFVRSGRGKPCLDGAPVAFSLSHVPGLALIGFGTSGAIGVDVERARAVRVRRPRRRRIEAAAAALNNEQALPGGDDARFLQAWVRLEAFAKAEGCGIGRLLTRLGIVGDREVTRTAILQGVASMRAEAQGKITRDLDLGEGLFAAVAVGAGQAVPEISWLPASVEGLDKLLA
jgi:phosphopantetheinyl transferase